jgi:hypothetical protein
VFIVCQLMPATTKRATRKKAVVAPEPIRPTAYKVLGANGESIHGGSLTWSLPTAEGPGEWHEVTGKVRCCSNGLHLTTAPVMWWQEEARVFVVEHEGDEDREGAEDDKFAVRRARLVREELDWVQFGVYDSGAHSVSSGHHRASGSASVRASGSASVRAFDSASVRAFDSASVRAFDSASVRAFDSASVEASGSASVRAFDSASVRASGSASVEAFDSASVEAFDSASVEAFDSASVRASGSVSVVRSRYHRKGWVSLADYAATIDRRGDTNGQPPVAHLAPWSDRPEDVA